MEQLLEELLAASRPYTKEGRLADYIPELSKADPNALGIYVVSSDGKHSWAGSYNQPFTIQSIVKPILLLLALMDNGIDAVRARVGVEATGKPFDAINTSEQALDSEHLNPMVNMGAIVMCTLIRGETYQERFTRLLDLTRKLADNPDITVDEAVYRSEKSHGSKNRALAYLLKTYGFLQDDVEEVLDCATCDDALRILKEEQLYDAVLARLAERIEFHLAHKCGEMAAGAIVFSKEYGLLCRTSRAQELLGTIMEG